MTNYQSRLYPNYNLEEDTRWQEVACNFFGLMQTEVDVDAYPALLPLKDQINKVVTKALASCRDGAGSGKRAAMVRQAG